MTAEDWRDARAEELAPLYTAERRRWSQKLWWDLGPSLAIAEAARVRGELPGVIVRDGDGRPIGWSFYLLAHGVLQIGALTAGSAGAVRLMLDRILSSPEAQLSQRVSCFLFPVSSSVSTALTRLRFTLTTHHYLSMDLPDVPTPPVAPDGWRVRGWQPQDAPAAVRLLARAYAGDPAARCFAPHGRMEQWAQYVGQLLQVPACGGFREEASAVVETAGASGPTALVITTLIAPGTVHVAQLAVDPAHRRQGQARALMAHAMEKGRALGARRITLVVSDGNAAARAAYAQMGFVPAGALVHGERGPAPRKLGPARSGSRPSATMPPTPGLHAGR